MRCWHCATPMIWGGDHDCEDNEDYLFSSNFSCPRCNTVAYIYFPKEHGL